MLLKKEACILVSLLVVTSSFLSHPCNKQEGYKQLGNKQTSLSLESGDYVQGRPLI